MGKIKIHELAKEIGMSSKDVLEKAKSLGIDVTSHLSNVTDEQATEIRNAYSKNNKNNVKKENKVENKKETKKETKTIYYYHYKTRKLVKEEKDETKTYTAWSFSKHDEALIKQGYEYTGIYEEVEIS